MGISIVMALHSNESSAALYRSYNYAQGMINFDGMLVKYILSAVPLCNRELVMMLAIFHLIQPMLEVKILKQN